MSIQELKNNIYWVGAVDYNVRDFHGYATPQGTSYNSYLILDEKKALVDTVKKGFLHDLSQHIAELTDIGAIDYLIINHVEMDHSGETPHILYAARKAKIVCSQKGKEGLIKHYGIGDRQFQVVKTGDTLSLGKKTLKFISAPMIHWPDSMFTYCLEDKVLLPNDAFGQHLAHPYRFADEIGQAYCLEELAKYYANILMPLGGVISKKIEELSVLGVSPEIIGPSHGAIWRKDLASVINAYRDWAAFRPKPKITICYDSMWDSTETLARRLVEFIAAENIEVKLYHIRKSDVTMLVRDILDSKVFLIGSPTLNSDMFWPVGGFLTYLRGLKPQKKKVGIFGSFGWSEAASKVIKREIESMGLEILEPPFEIQYVPTQEELKKLEEYAKIVVQATKA